MKFVYEYRTADNVRHTGSITAPDKDAVYAALKAKGIRPSRVTEAPGFLNKLFGKYKRWTAIVLLSALVAWLLVMILSGEGADGGAGRLSPRAQLYGDPVVVRECEDALWTNVFASAFDCRLAQYAIPGRVPNLVEPMASALPETPDAAVAFVEIAEEDLAEIVHMKRMVNGIKQELSDYITAGGTLVKYL